MQYDPEMVDAPEPGNLALLPSYPNPFHVGRDGDLVIPFELDDASPSTRLSIYAANGAMVRQFDLGARSARRYSVRWDGTNDGGVLVGTGIYHYVLEAAGRRRSGSLALVRD